LSVQIGRSLRQAHEATKNIKTYRSIIDNLKFYLFMKILKVVTDLKKNPQLNFHQLQLIFLFMSTDY